MSEPLCHAGVISSGHMEIAIAAHRAQKPTMAYTTQTGVYHTISNTIGDEEVTANTLLELQYTQDWQPLSQVRDILQRILNIPVREEETYFGALQRTKRAIERLMADVTPVEQCICLVISSALFSSRDEEVFFLDKIGTHATWPETVIDRVVRPDTQAYTKWGMIIHDSKRNMGILYLCPVQPRSA